MLLGRSVFEQTVYVGVDARRARVVPQRDRPQLIVVIPVAVKFVDVGLALLILLHLRVVEIERGDAAYHESGHIGVVAALRYLGGLVGYGELLLLVAEPFHEYEQILIEVHRFLTQAALRHLTVALGHLHLSAAFAPVYERYAQAYLHHLVVLEATVGVRNAVVGAGIAYLREERYLAQIALGLGHLIVGFELPAAQVAHKLVVGQSLFESVGIGHLHHRDTRRYLRLYLHRRLQIEKRPQGEHVALQLRLAVGHVGAGVEQVQLHLQQVVLADLTH